MLLQAMVKQIELWLIEKLVPFARNPRTHSDAQIAQIAASIAEFGFNNPILVDTKAGIIAGSRPSAGREETGADRGSGDRARPPQRGAEARLHHRRQPARAQRWVG